MIQSKMMKIFYTTLCMTLLLLSVIKGTVGVDKQPICSDGYIPDLDGNCIKKLQLPKRKSCQEPKVKFGGHSLSLGGRVVSYWCEQGWKLVPVGADSAVCKVGKWSRPPPQCVRAGCHNLIPPHDGRLFYEMDGAIARFQCTEGLEIFGESTLGCDGQYWNATEPQCVVPTTTTTSTTRRPRVRTVTSALDDTASGATTTFTHMWTLSIIIPLMLWPT